jgi:hypothetical protein
MVVFGVGVGVLILNLIFYSVKCGLDQLSADCFRVQIGFLSLRLPPNADVLSPLFLSVTRFLAVRRYGAILRRYP